MKIHTALLHREPSLHIWFALVSSIIILLAAPLPSHAAAAKPSCTLTASTTAKALTTKSDATFVLEKGEKISLAWSTTNAKRVTLASKTVDASGSKKYSPLKTTTYKLELTNGNKKNICSIKVQVVSADIKASLLKLKSPKKPALSGTASGLTAIKVVAYGSSDEPVYESKKIKVTKGKWKHTFTQKLGTGSYTIEILDYDSETVAASETLTVGSKKQAVANATTIQAELVPLLLGGIAKPGATVPVSYLQIINTGKVDAKIEGFEIKQNGSASTDAIISLTASDDIDSFRKTVGGTEGSKLFIKGMAVVPADAVIPPGEMRLFTIKAGLSKNAALQAGKQLKIDVSSLLLNGFIQSPLPIKGTTWTLGS